MEKLVERNMVREILSSRLETTLGSDLALLDTSRYSPKLKTNVQF